MGKWFVLPVAAALGLMLVSCGKPERPEEQIPKLLQDSFNSHTLFKADNVAVHSSSCTKEANGGDRFHEFTCKVDYTVRDIIGTPNRYQDWVYLTHDTEKDEWTLRR